MDKCAVSITHSAVLCVECNMKTIQCMHKDQEYTIHRLFQRVAELVHRRTARLKSSSSSGTSKIFEV